MVTVFTLALATAGAAQPGPGAAAAVRSGDIAAAPASDTATAPVPVPEPSEKALRYHRSGNVLWVVGTLWGFIVPALFLFTGLSARVRDAAQRVGRRWFFTVVIYFLLFALVTFVLDLPLTFYEEFVREHAYGLSNQIFAKWAGDTLKGFGIGTLFGAVVICIPYGLLRKSPNRWWLYTAVATIPVMILVMIIVPVWVDPLFNEFGPMKDKALERRILDLAARAGIEGGRVYEVAKSVDTTTVNAYVTGFMDTKRIVLWDTLLEKLDADEVLFVMGHEMGHYVLGHVVKGLAVFALVALVALYAVHRLSRGLIARYRGRFRFDRLDDIASLPLLLLIVQVVGFVIVPGVLACTRYQEHEADRFGLEITRGNRAAATAFVKLQQENLAVPRPGLLVKLWRESHPVLGDRIDFCNTYRPWAKGEPLKYAHLFRERETVAR
jgi:Zn-dependent protease with chaperone function